MNEYSEIYGPDVYKIDNEWGTLVSDKSSKGIFNLILQAVANQTQKKPMTLQLLLGFVLYILTLCRMSRNVSLVIIVLKLRNV